MTRPSCPSPDLLRDFSHGRLESAEESVEISRHLDECPSCLAAIAAEAAPRFRSDKERYDHELECERAVALIEGLASHGDTLPERIGSYRIIKRLAYGGMGTTYVAWHDELNRKVVLKLRRSGHASRFTCEKEALGKLDHPAIVRAFDAGHHEEYDFIVMEYVDGVTVEELLRMQKQRSVADTVELGVQIAETLAYLHDQNVVHLDVKPSNIMAMPDGQAKLIDLGLAQPPSLADIHGQSSARGTIEYMSPEQTGCGRSIDGKTDSYGLGSTLYAMLAGRPPLDFTDCEGVDDKLSLIRQSVPRPVTDYRDDVPSPLVSLIGELLAKEALHRPSVCEVTKRLRGLQTYAGRRAALLRLAGGGIVAAFLLAISIFVVVRLSAVNTKPAPSIWEPSNSEPAGLALAPAKLPGVSQWHLHTTLPLPAIRRATWSHDGKTLACIGEGTAIYLLSVDEQGEWKTACIFPDNGNLDAEFHCLRWSFDDQWLLVTSSVNPDICLWNTQTRTRGPRIRIAEETVFFGAEWEPGGHRFVSADSAGNLSLWDIDGQLLKRISAHEGAATTLSWRPATSAIASGGVDGNVQIWDIEADGLRSIAHYESLTQVAWHPTDDLLIVGDSEGR